MYQSGHRFQHSSQLLQPAYVLLDPPVICQLICGQFHSLMPSRGSAFIGFCAGLRKFPDTVHSFQQAHDYYYLFSTVALLAIRIILSLGDKSLIKAQLIIIHQYVQCWDVVREAEYRSGASSLARNIWRVDRFRALREYSIVSSLWTQGFVLQKHKSTNKITY